MTSSIKRQLLIFFLPSVSLLCIISSMLSYWLIFVFSSESFDRELTNSADSVAGRVRVREGKISVDLPPAAQAILKHDESDRFYYRVITENGATISGDAELPLPDTTLQVDEPQVKTAVIDQREVRLAQLRVQVADLASRTVTVQVAETINFRKHFQQTMFLSILVPQLLMIAITLLGGWYGIVKILRPLGRLQKQLSNRSPSDLRAVRDDKTPEEVLPLVTAINDLLSRLEQDLEAQKRFIANAAHQLRTPLAGLKTYSTIGHDSNDVVELRHVVSALDVGIDRAIRLVVQLLALARIEGSTQLPTDRTPVDLNFLVSDVTSALMDYATRKQVALTFIPSGAPAFVSGERTSLSHLITNLVENAVLYTPSGGSVTAQLVLRNFVELNVSDTGPGIPETELDKIFERFYRINGTPGTGSGLGLAIVKEVANAHSASIVLRKGFADQGVSVTILFPRLPSKTGRGEIQPK